MRRVFARTTTSTHDRSRMTLRNWILIALAASCLMTGSCARWHSAPILPTHNSIVLDQLVVFSDSPLPEHHRLLEELRSQRTLVSTKLGLPISDEPVHRSEE